MLRLYEFEKRDKNKYDGVREYCLLERVDDEYARTKIKKPAYLEPKTQITKYIISTYVLFVLLLVTLGGIATVFLDGTPLVMSWLTAVTAWTPTYVLLIMFKKLYPNSTIKGFYKRAFEVKLNGRLLITTTFIQMLIFTSSVYAVSTQVDGAIITLFSFSFPNIIAALFFTLIQGPTGEESGWRGYLQPAIEKKIGVVKGSLAVGLIWAFWHAPIWFFNTDYSGMELIKYIVLFVISITSVGFVMGLCYHHCKNLFVPIWIHFLFNFLGLTYMEYRITLLTWYAIFYLLFAFGFFLWHKKNCTI